MKSNLITCVVVPVGEKAYSKEIKNDLETLQGLVGGLIEVLPLSDRLLLICDEEAKIKGKEGNRRIGNDIIAGQFLIVGNDGSEFTGLDKYEVAAMVGRFAVPQLFTPEEVEESILFTFGEW